jgi:translocator assembly and maintenance protein 41
MARVVCTCVSILIWDLENMFSKSGRLQKPVSLTRSAHTTETASFDLAFQTNLQNALHTSLLLLPERFSLEELFVMITSLSYMGDFRMIVGENKNKCVNIVKPQVPAFTDLYKAYILKECIEDYLLCDFENGQCVQRSDQQTVYRHLNLLPKNLIQTIINLKFRTSQYHDLEEYIYKLTNRVDYKDIVAQSVASIVRYSSVIQSAKGVLSAGLVKTASYSMRKLKKMIN